MPECQKLKIKNGGLDQYSAEPFEQQHFETAGNEGVKYMLLCSTGSIHRKDHANSQHGIVLQINAKVTCEIKLFQPSSTSVSNNIISASGNWPKIISTLFQRTIVDREYFPMYSISQK